MEYTKPLAQLIEFFQKFPGIGPKSAQRMAFHLLKMPLSEVEKFSNILTEAKKSIHYCDICFNMSASNPCEICSDDRRDRTTICVIAETKDLIAIEKTREYKGFKDDHIINDYAVDSIREMYEYGVLNGDGEYVRPKSLATRAETAQLVHLMILE